jgi:hypothetical protein
MPWVAAWAQNRTWPPGADRSRRLHSDTAGCAGAILDHDRMLQRFSQRVADHAGGDVVRTAGDERSNRLGRIMISRRGHDEPDRQHRNKRQGDPSQAGRERIPRRTPHAGDLMNTVTDGVLDPAAI